MHTEIDDDTNNSASADELWPFEDIGTRVLECIMTQHTLKKGEVVWKTG